MGDPILPAPVPSRYHANNNNNNNATSSTTFSRNTTQQAQVVSGPGESDRKRLPVASSAVSSGDGGGDTPYEYPTMYPPKFPVGSYLSYVKRVATNSPVSFASPQREEDEVWRRRL